MRARADLALGLAAYAALEVAGAVIALTGYLRERAAVPWPYAGRW